MKAENDKEKMNIQSLRPAKGAKKKPTRAGRGYSAGRGKTAGRGQKGQNARSGGGVRPGFEGGQIPLIRKLAIRGFNNKKFAKVYAIVNVGNLEELDANSVVNEDLLLTYKIIGKKQPFGLKVLGGGELTKPLTVQAKLFSASAKEKIEKAGGKVEIIK